MIYNIENRDLFTVDKDYYLAHCISSDFAMGRGIAVSFCKLFNMKNILLNKYPNYESYFLNNHIKGDCILEGRVLNLITKQKYFNKPTYTSIVYALTKMKTICLNNNIKKIAMPLIGCGLDNLEWTKIKKILIELFKDMDIKILVCIN